MLVQRNKKLTWKAVGALFLRQPSCWFFRGRVAYKNRTQKAFQDLHFWLVVVGWVIGKDYKWHFSCQLGGYISLIPPDFSGNHKTAIDIFVVDFDGK